MEFELIPADTTREADFVQMDIYRRMSPARKLELALQMGDFVREITTAGVRSRHPEYDEEQVRLAVIRLTLGDALFHKAYPGTRVEI